jgi:3-phenylpropionate/cinnamic acid dioxygenase small subunit
LNDDHLATTIGVTELLNRYAHTCDDRLLADFAALFLPDSSLLITGELYRGPEGARRWLESVLDHPPGTHITMNVIVRPEATDEATSVAAFVFVRRQDGTGPWEIVNVGRYHDRLVRTPDGWKFAAREIVLH